MTPATLIARLERDQYAVDDYPADERAYRAAWNAAIQHAIEVIRTWPVDAHGRFDVGGSPPSFCARAECRARQVCTRPSVCVGTWPGDVDSRFDVGALVVDDETFDRLTDAIENPREPNNALRDLFKKGTP